MFEMFHLAKWMLNAFWCIVGFVCFFSGAWLVIGACWSALWVSYDPEMVRHRRFAARTGGLLLCAATVIFVGVFC